MGWKLAGPPCPEVLHSCPEVVHFAWYVAERTENPLNAEEEELRTVPVLFESAPKPLLAKDPGRNDGELHLANLAGDLGCDREVLGLRLLLFLPAEAAHGSDTEILVLRSSVQRTPAEAGHEFGT